MVSAIRTLKSFTASLVWYNGKKKRPGCIRRPGIHLTTFYANGLRLNRVALSKKSDSAENPSQTAYVLHYVAERGEVILAFVTIYTIGNGHQPYIMLREKLFGQLADLNVVAAQPGQVFYEYSRNVSSLDCSYHFLKSGPLHGSSCDTVIHEKDRVRIALILGGLLQYLFLESDLSRVFSPRYITLYQKPK